MEPPAIDYVELFRPDRSLKGRLGDKGALIAVALAVSVVMGSAVWLINRLGIPGIGTAILFAVLAIDLILARIRIKKLEAKLEKHRIS